MCKEVRARLCHLTEDWWQQKLGDSVRAPFGITLCLWEEQVPYRGKSQKKLTNLKVYLKGSHREANVAYNVNNVTFLGTNFPVMYDLSCQFSICYFTFSFEKQNICMSLKIQGDILQFSYESQPIVKSSLEKVVGILFSSIHQVACNCTLDPPGGSRHLYYRLWPLTSALKT